jgi:SAM-dependent methyltransferase
MVALAPIEWSKAYASWGLTTRSLERAYSTARLLDILRAYLPRVAGARILELGAAPGRWLAWVESCLGLKTVGLDLDAEGATLSKRLFPGLRMIRADAVALPFADGSFDGSFSLGLLEHFDDPRGLLRETRRTLKAGGTMICSVPNIAPGSFPRWHWRTFGPHQLETHRTYSLDELVQLVKGSGFEVLHQEYNGLYVPRAQRVMGRLPARRLLKRFESARLATSLVVVARASGQ